MKIKADETKQMHKFRKREFDSIFKNCPDDLFSCALEMGAGDGFQSQLLVRCIKNLVCTELNEKMLKKIRSPRIEYAICDAEKIASYFPAKKFDLVFSSNLLEHLPDIDAALTGVHSILKDDGVAIHAMPNCFWKLSHMLFFYPNLAIRLFESVTDYKWLQKLFQKSEDIHLFKEEYEGDNLKDEKSHKISPLAQILWPYPHGISASNLAEFKSFSQKKWLQTFAKNNFEVATTLTSPFSSGYRFGLDGIRSCIEALGIGSEYIYITTKKESNSPYLKYFLDL